MWHFDMCARLLCAALAGNSSGLSSGVGLAQVQTDTGFQPVMSPVRFSAFSPFFVEPITLLWDPWQLSHL